MNSCYFCGATAPKPRKFRGIWSMTCKCGAKIEHPDYESVMDMWNYKVK